MPETQWLTADEQTVWRSFLSAVRLLTDQLDRELQRDSHMPHTYYEILVVLSETPGRTMRMSELADLTLSSRSRLSHAVARLEQTGYVSRDSCDTDRRGSFATLTQRGFKALQNASHGHVTGVRTHLFESLTPDQVRQLGEISTAVRDGLERQRSSPEA